jgi:hypothetical protein
VIFLQKSTATKGLAAIDGHERTKSKVIQRIEIKNGSANFTLFPPSSTSNNHST